MKKIVALVLVIMLMIPTIALGHHDNQHSSGHGHKQVSTNVVSDKNAQHHTDKVQHHTDCVACEKGIEHDEPVVNNCQNPAEDCYETSEHTLHYNAGKYIEKAIQCSVFLCHWLFGGK